MKFKHISTKLAFSFGFILLLVLMMVTALSIIDVEKERYKAHEDLIQSVNTLNELITLKAQEAEALAVTYSKDERIIAALKNGDRGEMERLVSPIFTSLNGVDGLAVFEIGDS